MSCCQKLGALVCILQIGVFILENSVCTIENKCSYRLYHRKYVLLLLNTSVLLSKHMLYLKLKCCITENNIFVIENSVLLLLKHQWCYYRTSVSRPWSRLEPGCSQFACSADMLYLFSQDKNCNWPYSPYLQIYFLNSADFVNNLWFLAIPQTCCKIVVFPIL